MSEYVQPDPERLSGKPMTKRVSKGNSIKIDHHYASPCDPGREYYSSWYA
jgi:hypothetical protein